MAFCGREGQVLGHFRNGVRSATDLTLNPYLVHLQNSLKFSLFLRLVVTVQVFELLVSHHPSISFLEFHHVYLVDTGGGTICMFLALCERITIRNLFLPLWQLLVPGAGLEVR